MMARLLVLFVCLFAISCDTSERAPDDRQITTIDDDAPPRPNIVIIMADDLGWSDIGAFGGEISTPTLDRLAANGLKFTTFYNWGRCWPTRASLLTGHYPHVAGLGGALSPSNRPLPEPGPYQGYLKVTTPTIAEVLKPAGYRSYLSGKWHVGERKEHWPLKRGFDRYFGLISGATSFFELLEEPGRERWMALDDAPWSPPAEGFYATDAYSDMAVQYVRDHSRDYADSPFFLYLAYTAPHFPLHAKKEDIARYAGKYDEGWDIIRQRRIQRLHAFGLIDDRFADTGRPRTIPAWDRVEDKAFWTRRMEVYAAMVDNMDQGVGRLVAALEETGQLDNTLIVFFSDNGASAENMSGRKLNDPEAEIGAKGSYIAYREPWAWVSNAPYRGYKKQTLEGGVNSPMIAHWPQGVTERGATVATPLSVLDLMATVRSLSGAAYPASFGGAATPEPDGADFSGLLTGKRDFPDRALFFEHLGHRALRDGNWKLVYDPQTQRWSLYDLADDPAEAVDRTAAEPGRAARMIERWHDWAQSVGVREASP